MRARREKVRVAPSMFPARWFVQRRLLGPFGQEDHHLFVVARILR
jgi:hypothetical protein